MRLGRMIIAAIVITAVQLLYGWLTCGWLFSWVYELAPTCVWVPMNTMGAGMLVWMVIGHLFLYFLFVLVFSVLYRCMPGTCRGTKGAVYGFFVWIVGTLPGMFATYTFMTVNTIVVVYWTFSGLIGLLIAGLIAGWICGSKGESKGGCCCG